MLSSSYDGVQLTLNPLYVQLPNLMEQCWSSKGNQVMSIWHEDCNEEDDQGGLLMMDGDKEMVKYKIAIKEMEKITLKIPGGMYVHVPSEVTTTFVGKVPSKASLALMQIWLHSILSFHW